MIFVFSFSSEEVKLATEMQSDADLPLNFKNLTFSLISHSFASFLSFDQLPEKSFQSFPSEETENLYSLIAVFFSSEEGM